MLFTKMENIVKTGRGQHWTEEVGRAENIKDIYPWTDIPCRHMLTGRVTARKVCTKNYECYHCAYDQWLADQSEILDLRQ